MIVRATRDFRWFSAQTNYHPGPAARGIEAVADDGIHGMVICDDWTPGAVRMHVALTGAGSARALLRAAFQYAFVQCDKEMAIGIMPEGSRSARLADSLGFDELGRIHRGFDQDTDLLIMAMERRKCRYISRKEAA